MKLIGDRILVVPDPPEEKVGSVVLPVQAQRDTSTGEIKAIGPEVNAETLDSGDRVVFSKYGGTGLSLEGDDYIVLRPSDILVVL